jgi:hypothetical protein
MLNEKAITEARSTWDELVINMEKDMINKLQGKIFLIEPFEESTYKKLIIYSDTSESARSAANQKYHPNKKSELDLSGEEHIYLDQNFSFCSEIKPKIILIDSQSNLLKINYEGVEYQLEKNKPEEHIGGGWI